MKQFLVIISVMLMKARDPHPLIRTPRFKSGGFAFNNRAQTPGNSGVEKCLLTCTNLLYCTVKLGITRTMVSTGMTDSKSKPNLYMKNLVDMTKVIRKVGFGPLWLLYLKDPADADDIAQGVGKITDQVKALKREDIPERYHYKNHKYMGDIMLLTNGEVFIGEHSSAMSVHTVPLVYVNLQMRATRATTAWMTSASTPQTTTRAATQT